MTKKEREKAEKDLAKIESKVYAKSDALKNLIITEKIIEEICDAHDEKKQKHWINVRVLHDGKYK